MFTVALSPRCPLADEGIRNGGTYTQWNITQLLKKNISESVLMRWIKLETIIQSEVSKSERKIPIQYTTHIHGIQKEGNNDPV